MLENLLSDSRLTDSYRTTDRHHVQFETASVSNYNNLGNMN